MDQEEYILARSRQFCNYCPGYCCYSLPGASLYITAEDINRMGRHFGISDGEVRKRFIESRNTFKTRADGSCIFLENGKVSKRCSIHEARPRQCREFPYDKPCPYLERDDLLEQIVPKVEMSFISDRKE
jgi:Fe-S-cluster containining protein